MSCLTSSDPNLAAANRAIRRVSDTYVAVVMNIIVILSVVERWEAQWAVIPNHSESEHIVHIDVCVADGGDPRYLDVVTRVGVDLARDHCSVLVGEDDRAWWLHSEHRHRSQWVPQRFGAPY